MHNHLFLSLCEKEQLQTVSQPDPLDIVWTLCMKMAMESFHLTFLILVGECETGLCIKGTF